MLADTKNRQTKLEFDVFENESAERLQQLVQNNITAYRRVNPWLYGNNFAVLDHRSTQDNTVVIWNKRPISEIDEQAEEWMSWRVSFPDAHELTAHLVAGSTEIVDKVFTHAHDHFTGSNGVFELQRALKELGYKE